MNISKDTKLIPVGQDKFAIVDTDDYDMLTQWKWCFYNRYARRTVTSKGKNKTLAMHRFLMGEPENMQVDHIDGNGLNNSRSNLRVCSHAENMQNRLGASKNNKSGYKGVSLVNSKSWVAQVYKDNKRAHRSFHQTKEEAAKAYDEAALKLHGEFACTNKMMGLI